MIDIKMTLTLSYENDKETIEDIISIEEEDSDGCVFDIFNEVLCEFTDIREVAQLKTIDLKLEYKDKQFEKTVVRDEYWKLFELVKTWVRNIIKTNHYQITIDIIDDENMELTFMLFRMLNRICCDYPHNISYNSKNMSEEDENTL